MKIYAFDVDETLEISGGPIKMLELEELKAQGHIIGLCGNYAMVTLNIEDWHNYISFIGPMGMTKDGFLAQLKTYVSTDEVVMVGNILGVSGASDDKGAAEKAEVRFISEHDFASGKR